MSQNEEIIELEVLRAASTEVLGTSKELSVATPCQFSNAKGSLRAVSSFKELGSIATSSAKTFKSGLKTAKALPSA